MLEVVHAMYPEAPIYTSIFWPEALPPAYRDWDIRPSFLDRFPFIHRHHQWYLPFYPYAFEGFDFSDYDLVLSITSAFAHGVITSPPNLAHLLLPESRPLPLGLSQLCSPRGCGASGPPGIAIVPL